MAAVTCVTGIFSALVARQPLVLYSMYCRGFSYFLYVSSPLSFANRITANIQSSFCLVAYTMPSDLAKKKAAKKKEAAKARQRSKKPEELNGEAEQGEAQQNGADSNGERRTPSGWSRRASLQ